MIKVGRLKIIERYYVLEFRHEFFYGFGEHPMDSNHSFFSIPRFWIELKQGYPWRILVVLFSCQFVRSILTAGSYLASEGDYGVHSSSISN